ncbi:glucose 1-dehydrogenase [Cellulomonas aerilata]|uniref:Threonine dehydrogenase n=1 Tax=Cellulomonas aerilata TaxID=515326 RepID=A0A512D9F7_9CELL|nr:glucose 1-dehydrogenase [Cellulomonas aerilata]GEO33122.1 threonine dehydrogenase [Cellulomonas aerilata]
MQALTVRPGSAGSLEVRDVADPGPEYGDLLVQGLALGVCGTDREIADGEFGAAPPGEDHLVLGHESLGRVLEAPEGSEFSPGDLVAGVVRRPDPEPCGACARGQFDMCRNGRYTERGIKELHGYGSRLWRVESDYAIRLDPSLEQAGVLMEPTSVVAKAWDQIEKVGNRSWFDPQRVLITGAGPIGLLAAMLGVQRGIEVHVLDLATEGVKPDLVRALGGEYHSDPVADVLERLKPDIVIEATGAAQVVVPTLGGTSAYGITCLTGVSASGRRTPVDAGALNRGIVLENDVVIGSVNANFEHYRAAADGLAAADLEWLHRLITRTVPLERAAEAFDLHDDDVKVVLDLT